MKCNLAMNGRHYEKEANTNTYNCYCSFTVAAAAIIIVHRYNMPKVAIGISRSFDGKVNYPLCSSSATSNFGLSSSGQKKEQELMKYFRDAVGNEMVKLLQEYDDLSLNTTIEYKDKKTIVPVFGQGIPKSGEAGLMHIDQIYELDYKYEILNN